MSAPLRRLLAVHAHPDDESITMSATLARYVASGAEVTLVTATLGEQGELMHGRRGGLDADHADQLGGYRLHELDRACAAMGITQRRILGGLGRFRDSGMAGEPSARHPRAFCRAGRSGPDHDEAVAGLTAILDDLRPEVVLTYDADGGYGHPDHVTAHQVTVDAVERYRAAGACCRLLAVVRPRPALADALERLWSGPVPPAYRRPTIGQLGTTVEADDVDVTIPVGPWGAVRRAAMGAHATQLDVWPGPVIDAFALTNLYAQPLLDAEYFTVLSGPPAPAGATDLFAGL